MTSIDTDKCAVKWCQEAPRHPDVHRLYLGEVMLSRRQGIASINLTIEAANYERHPRLVLTIPTTTSSTYSSATLTWTQVDHLRAMLTKATKRWRTR